MLDYFTFVFNDSHIREVRMAENITPLMRVVCAYMAAKEYWGDNEPDAAMTSVRSAWDRLKAIASQPVVTQGEALQACELVYYATCGKWHYNPNERTFNER